MENTPQEKLAAEIELIQAQTRKVQAETKAPHRFMGFSEAVKLIGSVILGLGGVTAAITGYQFAELKKDRIEFEMEVMRHESAEVSQLLVQKKADYAKTEADFKELETRLANVKAELASVPSVPPATSANLAEIVAFASKATADSNQRGIAFEVMKNEMMKASQIQQALENIRRATEEMTNNVIRKIKV
jgi:hypothetical protein